MRILTVCESCTLCDESSTFQVPELQGNDAEEIAREKCLVAIQKV